MGKTESKRSSMQDVRGAFIHTSIKSQHNSARYSFYGWGERDFKE